MNEDLNTLEVYLDVDTTPVRIGTLSRDGEQIRFRYDDAWRKSGAAFQIDPSLELAEGEFFPDAKQSNFGIFLDSAPDRWGQKLMERRERLVAQEAGRRPRALSAWDFLIGVQDATRMGALRFKAPGDQPFLDHQRLPAPPVTSLAELQDVAHQLTRPGGTEHLDQLRRWLSVLVAPGASLGGARPKANFRQVGGELWIAKFPARDDTYDVALWEKLIHDMAHDADIKVPHSRLERFGDGYHTFCVQRFDRKPDGTRQFFISAMSGIGAADGTEGSYLDLVQFIQDRGTTAQDISTQLAQLFRRVIFSAQVGNRDDHLRNHGFTLEAGKWGLSKAYDMNTDFTKDEHVLSFDGAIHAPDISVILSTAEYYRLNQAQAEAILKEVSAITKTWKERARALGIKAAEIAELGARHLLPA